MIVREPALAGRFYAQHAAVLSQEVDGYLMDQDTSLSTPQQAPKALILPHAGYCYSGPVAGVGYQRLIHHLANIQRVVLLCPAHREYFKGVALPNVLAFATPLGTLEIDTLGVATISDLPCVLNHAKAHAQEHAIEVHLPFLQRLWARQNIAFPRIVPLVVGDVAVSEVAAVIERLWGNSQTLILISTDLSHYHPYLEARDLDSHTCSKIHALQADISPHQACGAIPLNALLVVLKKRGLGVEQLAYCNSGDRPSGNSVQGRSRVVGYASFAAYEPMLQTTILDITQGKTLLELARQSLHAAVCGGSRSPVTSADLEALGATFVTLTKQGQLRGCMGSLSAQRSLAMDVWHNAQAAALRDPRFAPVSAVELADIDVEVSVLSTPQPIYFANYAHALWQLAPHRDGVIFSVHADGREYRSTFLPQVWEQLPAVEDFMARLQLKAGVPAQYWSPKVRLMRYGVEKFHV